MTKPFIAVIVGPTAAGKTASAVAAAQRLNAEIVSADAFQIYRGLDIGTAKPTDSEQKDVPHHLVDCQEPDRADYSAAEYKKDADRCIKEIRMRGKLPMVVGGTGLYINSLTYPLNFTDVKPNPKLREELIEEEEKCPGCLYKRLEELDPVTAKRLHFNDKKRIIRAIEVCVIGGKPFSEYGNDFANLRNLDCDYDSVIVGITMPREMLYERINARVDVMMENGFLDEVKELIKCGYDTTLPAFNALGYKQLIKFLTDNDEKLTLDETVELIKRETRRFAKRQLTWFRRDKRINWLNADEFDSVDDIGERIAVIINAGRQQSEA